MPSLRRDPVVAVCLSDVHLSLRPPIARDEEASWLDAQKLVWDEVAAIAKRFKAPIICAGDLFDRWNPPIELVNWALDCLPTIYAIPGNHDLPSHRHEAEHRSAYGALVRAGRVIPLTPEGTQFGDMLYVFGFPFGTEVSRPPRDGRQLGTCVAVVHEYLWIPQATYKNAPSKQRLGKHRKRFAGWDIVVVGDNHTAFKRKLGGGTTVLNCGTLLRRKSNEADYEPQVGLIRKSGKVTSHLLDTSRDVLTVVVHEALEEHDVSTFVSELNQLHHTSLDFRDSMLRALDAIDADEDIRREIEKAMK